MFEAFTLREESVRKEAEQLRHKVETLSSQQRVEYYTCFNEKVKDPDTYATLNWFFLTGLHHIYLGNYVQGLINLCVMLVGLALCFSSPLFGACLIALIILLELPALFRSQIIVEHENNQLGQRLYEDVVSKP